MIRLLAIPLALILVVRLLWVFEPLMSTSMRLAVKRWRATIDVAGGLIMLVLIVIQAIRGEWLGVGLLTLLGIPVFIGMYQSLPLWWYGTENNDR
jgi:hypothetical protein